MGELVRKFIANSVKIYVCNSCNFHLAKTTDIISKVNKLSESACFIYFSYFRDTVDQRTSFTKLSTLLSIPKSKTNILPPGDILSKIFVASVVAFQSVGLM